MAITLKYECLKDQNFLSAIRKIGAYSFKDIRFAAGIMKFIKRLNEEMTIAQDLYTKLIKQYAKVDEKGEIVQPKDQPAGSFDIPTDKMDEWLKARKDFEDTTFTIKIMNKARLEHFQNVGLTPVELLAIEDMTTDLEAVPTEDTAATA